MAVLLDGVDAAKLAATTGVPAVHLLESVGSTMDEAHRLGEAGAPDSTVIVALRQDAGRGRHGRKWSSDADGGLWMTFLSRSTPVSGLDVLSIRIGLALASKLDGFAEQRVRLKWPNDLLIGTRKLAGILVEARWRDSNIEWAAIGVGVNVAPPADQPHATALRTGTSRSGLFAQVVPAIAAASRAEGELTTNELMAYASRDSSRDAMLLEPAAGVARGITANGALIVETPDGRKFFRRGSLRRASEDE